MSKYDPEEYQKNKEKHLERQRRYKEKHKSLINERQRDYRKSNGKTNYKLSRQKRLEALKAKYIDFMKTQSCINCGYDDWRALVWHHINPKSKKNGVVQLINKHNSWATIQKEIEKCECMCHNCHNIIHNHSSKSKQ